MEKLSAVTTTVIEAVRAGELTTAFFCDERIPVLLVNDQGACHVLRRQIPKIFLHPNLLTGFD